MPQYMTNVTVIVSLKETFAAHLDTTANLDHVRSQARQHSAVHLVDLTGAHPRCGRPHWFSESHNYHTLR
jgi:hypothetical protein